MNKIIVSGLMWADVKKTNPTTVTHRHQAAQEENDDAVVFLSRYSSTWLGNDGEKQLKRSGLSELIRSFHHETEKHIKWLLFVNARHF